MFFRHAHKSQEAFRQQRAHMVHELHQLVEEGSSINKCRSASNGIKWHRSNEHLLRILESASQKRDFDRREAQHLRDNCHRSEQAGLLSREEVEHVNFPLNEARNTGEYSHNIHEINLTGSHRIATERDRALFQGRAILRSCEEEKNTSETRKSKRWTLKVFSKITLLDNILADQSHLAVVTPCQLHGQNFQLYLLFSRKENFLPNEVREDANLSDSRSYTGKDMDKIGRHRPDGT